MKTIRVYTAELVKTFRVQPGDPEDMAQEARRLAQADIDAGVTDGWDWYVGVRRGDTGARILEVELDGA